MFNYSIRELIEEQRFIEALYFGLIDLKSNPTSELHLYLGIACCATIKPIAELQRFFVLELDSALKAQSYFEISGLGANRTTLLVNEGLHHLLQAKELNPQVVIPPSLTKITRLVINNLQDYLRQEFKDFFVSDLDYSLIMATFASIVLICELQGDEPEKSSKLSTIRIEAAHELIKRLSSIKRTQADFYQIL